MALKSAEQYGVPLLCWSGGLDSTVLLLSLLCEYEKVDVISVDLKYQTKKMEKEEKARGAILGKAILKHRKDPLSYGKVNRQIKEFTSGTKASNGPKLPQLTNWIGACVNHVDPTTNGLYVGVVAGDAQVYQITSGQDLWIRTQEHAMVTGFGGKPCPLQTPLWDTQKVDMILPGAKDYLNKVSWCENLHVDGDCGICNSCYDMANHLALQKLTDPIRWQNNPLRVRMEKIFAKIQKHHKENKVK